MRFEYFKDEAKEWRWRIVAANGATVADGSEGYKTKQGCLLAVWRIQRLMSKPLEVREVKK